MADNRVRYWGDEDTRQLRAMAKAEWSVHMIAKQLDRLPWEVETHAEVMGLKLSDRTAGLAGCEKCGRMPEEICPYAATVCPRVAKFVPDHAG